MTTFSTPAAPITYRPLHESWGDADALAELRAIRAERAAADQRQLDLAAAAAAHERARRRMRSAGRHRRGHGRGLHLLPA